MAERSDITTSGNPPPPEHLERYPWHAELWGRVTRDRERLPHALLLHGPAGVGKRALAWRLTHALLCVNPGDNAAACGSCPSCVRFAAGTHPDLLVVGLIDDAAAIGVDQIRAVRDFAALTPHTSERKIIIIVPAERMNLNSANALLKVLEEPPAGSQLLLVSSQPARLPATIRSRCAALALRTPEPALALRWLSEQGVQSPGTVLRLAAGAPLLALAYSRSGELKDRDQVWTDIEQMRAGSLDPLTCAARWKSYGAVRCLEWFQHYLVGQVVTAIDNNKFGFSSKYLFDCFDAVSRAKALADGPLDETLLLEDLLIGWSGASRRVG